MGLTDFTYSRLVPALRSCGLTADEIASSRRVQEVAYLLERLGCGLGYRYKWEVFGPFSPELAEDVQALDRSTLSTHDEEPTVDDRAVRVTRLIDRPDHVDMSDDAWLRLVVCVDFAESRVPGITENGASPAYIALNFPREAIDAAREGVRELML